MFLKYEKCGKYFYKFNKKKNNLTYFFFFSTISNIEIRDAINFRRLFFFFYPEPCTNSYIRLLFSTVHNFIHPIRFYTENVNEYVRISSGHFNITLISSHVLLIVILNHFTFTAEEIRLLSSHVRTGKGRTFYNNITIIV